MTLTHVGYQPTGIKPFDLLMPGLLTSKTARQLLSALAMYKVFSSSLNATPLVVEPCRESGYKAAFKCFKHLTLLNIDYRNTIIIGISNKQILPIFCKHISFGLSPTAILLVNLFVLVLKTIILSPPQHGNV